MNLHLIISTENHNFRIPSFNFTLIELVSQTKNVITNIIHDTLNVSITKKYASSFSDARFGLLYNI
jgi:hypothetical protein